MDLICEIKGLDFGLTGYGEGCGELRGSGELLGLFRVMCSREILGMGSFWDSLKVSPFARDEAEEQPLEVSGAIQCT